MKKIFCLTLFSIIFSPSLNIAQVHASGSLTEKVNNELHALVTGPGAGDFNIYQNTANSLGGAFKINNNSWTSKLDFSGVMVWQSEWGDGRKMGTLVTPQFMIQAAHYIFPLPKKVRFVDKNGNVEERTAIEAREIKNARGIPNPDIYVVKLDSPLPSDRFKFYKVVSDTDLARKTSFDIIPLITNWTHGQTNNLKILSVNQEKSVVIHQAQGRNSEGGPDTWETSIEACPVSESGYKNPSFSNLRNGDSGGPNFILLNNELIYLGPSRSALICFASSFVGAFIDEINTAISSMGSTDRLQVVSLSNFTNVNHYPKILNRFRSDVIDLRVEEKKSIGTVVGKVQAEDSDLGQTLTFSVSGGTGKDFFGINPSTGDIFIKADLDWNSPVLRATTVSVTANPQLTLEIKVEDNGTPRKASYINNPYSDGTLTSLQPIKVEVLKSTASISSSPTISITDSFSGKVLNSTTPLQFSYTVANWPASSFNISLVPHNADGVVIAGGSYGLGTQSVTDLVRGTYGRSGSGYYSQNIIQENINLFEARAKSLNTSGKLPIKYKVKICGSGINSSVCSTSSNYFQFSSDSKNNQDNYTYIPNVESNPYVNTNINNVRDKNSVFTPDILNVTNDNFKYSDNNTREQLIESIRAQLIILIAEYNRLKAIEDAQNGIFSSNDPLKGYQFAKTFGVGTNDREVRYLQRFLNTYGFVVTSSGLGSFKQEIDNFGQLTKSALQRFQASEGIEATGYFGQLTRARVNELLRQE